MGGIMMPYMGDMAQQGAVYSIASPDVVPNITLWYNASGNATVVSGVSTSNFQTATLNPGVEVTKWKDLSGVGQDANIYNAGGGNGPLYQVNIKNGLSALQYVSANKRNLDINPINAWAKSKSGFTVYTVLKMNSLPGTAEVVVCTDTNVGHSWTGTYWQVGDGTGLATAQSTTVATATWTIHGMIFDGSYTNAGNITDQNNGRLKYRYNKAAQPLTFSANAATTTSGSSSVMYIGGNNRNSPTSFTDSYIGEVLMWTRALTTSEQQAVENYLNTKWGVGL